MSHHRLHYPQFSYHFDFLIYISFTRYWSPQGDNKRMTHCSLQNHEKPTYLSLWRWVYNSKHHSFKRYPLCRRRTKDHATTNRIELWPKLRKYFDSFSCSLRYTGKIILQPSSVLSKIRRPASLISFSTST